MQRFADIGLLGFKNQHLSESVCINCLLLFNTGFLILKIKKNKSHWLMSFETRWWI